MTDPLAGLDFEPAAVGDEIVAAHEVQFDNAHGLPMRCLNCGSPWGADMIENLKNHHARAEHVGFVTCADCHTTTGRATHRRGADHNRWVVIRSQAEAVFLYHPRPKSRTTHR